MSYIDAYIDGQNDVMTLLECDGTCGEPDHVEAAIAGDAARLRFRMWCLGHNLAIAGALEHVRECTLLDRLDRVVAWHEWPVSR